MSDLLPRIDNQPPKLFRSRPEVQAALGFGTYLLLVVIFLISTMVPDSTLNIYAPIWIFILGMVAIPVAALMMLMDRQKRMFALGFLIGAMLCWMILLAICFHDLSGRPG